MATEDLVAFHLRIDESVKRIMKDGKIDQFDIPEIVLLVSELVLSPSAKKMTPEMLSDKMNKLFDYIMAQYKLYPDDEAQKESFKRLFDISVRLALLEPNIKKACSTCLF
jgi:hypothetical protein